MMDATFTRVQPIGRGSTPASPIVFCVKVGGGELAWGRGKTQDAAIDCACRAAFALVAAHGHYEFELDDDCLCTEPLEVWNGEPSSGAPPPPPPPPPPLPPGKHHLFYEVKKLYFTSPSYLVFFIFKKFTITSN